MFLTTRTHKPVNYASFGKDDKVIREPSMFRNCPELEKENVMTNAINVVTLFLFVKIISVFSHSVVCLHDAKGSESFQMILIN